ncbi:MAG: hypothetical protein FWF82_05475 [Oscillospiraceae bacterium]|nr:hypothetical protein [Oscillospiraceae bacterium]
MNPNVSITAMNIDGREFILAEVSRGMNQIGVFKYNSGLYSSVDVFFIEDEPIIKISNSSRIPDDSKSKQVIQVSGAEKCSDFIHTRISAAIDNYFNYSQGLMRSSIPILEMLSPGLYIVHESQMFPSDGSGNFFWNSYNNSRELYGSAVRNSIIGDKNYSPCFMIPSQQPSNFHAKKLYTCTDRIRNGVPAAGIAYHVSGMFSALLGGHHAATAAAANDADFKCLVVEPLQGVIYGGTDRNAKTRKITALTCPFINIPIESLPENALERFLITRKQAKPVEFPVIKAKISKSLHTVSKKVFPANVYDKMEQYPDVTLVESASAINSLSDEQLEALLNGRVKVNDDDAAYIVESNYFSSMSTATDFLQVNDTARFLDFTVKALRKEEDFAAHKYITERLLTFMHQDIFDFFEEYMNDESTPKTGIVAETAEKYVGLFKHYIQKRKDNEEGYNKQSRKKVENMKAITEAKGIATLEAAVRDVI